LKSYSIDKNRQAKVLKRIRDDHTKMPRDERNDQHSGNIQREASDFNIA